jgi:excisionase family DNA binding protein
MQKFALTEVGSAVYSVAQFAKLLGLSKAAVYLLLDRGTVKEIKIAGRRLIPVAEFEPLMKQAA